MQMHIAYVLNIAEWFLAALLEQWSLVGARGISTA